MDEQIPPITSQPRMGLRDYLEQTQIWIDPRTGDAHPIGSLTDGRRLFGARQLRSRATAYITQLEAVLLAEGRLAEAVMLMDRAPTTWIEDTALYGALFRDEGPAPTKNPGLQMAEVALKMSGQPNSQ